MIARRRLLWALALSGALHVVWLTDLEWHLPFSAETPDEVLLQQKAEAVKRVRLAVLMPVGEPGIPTVTLLRPGTMAAKPLPATAASNVAAQPPKSAATATKPATPPTVAAEAAGAPEASEGLTATEAIEPAPSFPVSVLAIQRANYYGFRMELRQQWLMEGNRYLIRNEASKFGFSATISSEGNVSPDGLLPQHYRLLLNNELKQYADFDRRNGVLTHGKAGARKTMPLVDDVQDMASLPFHVAVSYEGEKEQRLTVTTGSSVYDIVLRLVSEDRLKLPGGELRTLHLVGSRTHSDGSLQTGYDIWLAPDYRNFPVKFRGPDSKGNMLEMSVLSLNFDDKPVFGKHIKEEALPPEPDALPSGLPEELSGGNTPPAPSAASPPDEVEPTEAR